MEGSRRGAIKPARTVNGRHCCMPQEEAWIYEAEPDWVVNLTRWARGRGHSLSLCRPYSPPQDALVQALGKGDAGVKGGGD